MIADLYKKCWCKDCREYFFVLGETVLAEVKCHCGSRNYILQRLKL